MRTFQATVVLFILLSACEWQTPITPQRRASVWRSPRIDATVIKVHTRVGPKAGAWNHLVVLANNRMRIGYELDQWRLFDLQNDAVTWVDDIDKTYRTIPGATLRRDALAASQLPLPPGIDEAHWVASGARRRIAGVDATQHILRAGGYQREIWVGTVPGVPDRFLSLAFATDSNKGPYSGLMKHALPAMLGMSGFVVLDIAELPVVKLRVEKVVTEISQRAIPAAWLSIPPGYKNVSPQPLKGSGAGRPRASSPPSDQSTRAAESQPSATARRSP